MVNAVKQFFEKYIKSPSDSSDKVSEHSLQIATAALLIRMMQADAEVRGEEKITIAKSLRSKFNLTEEEVSSLLKMAEDEI